jgi:hypothetical protein
MRALWIGVSLALVTALAGACGDDQAEDTTAASGGGGGGGKSGGAASGGAGAAGKSTGGSANGGVSGTVASGGAANNSSGASGTDANAGAGGSGDTNAGGAGGSSGAGTGGAPNPAAAGAAGASGAAASSAGGDGSAGSPGDCDLASPDKVIFVSSALYTGNLGGLTGADNKCQTLADAAKLCGTFKAWLSDGTGNAADRLTHATGDYVLPDGQVVANGWTGLTSGSLLHAINQTESKGAAPVGTVKCVSSGPVPVWTGATYSGIAVQNGSCSNWASTSTGPGAAFGNASATSFAWSGTCQIVTLCPNTAALYCVQQ